MVYKVVVRNFIKIEANYTTFILLISGNNQLRARIYFLLTASEHHVSASDAIKSISSVCSYIMYICALHLSLLYFKFNALAVGQSNNHYNHAQQSYID